MIVKILHCSSLSLLRAWLFLRVVAPQPALVVRRTGLLSFTPQTVPLSPESPHNNLTISCSHPAGSGVLDYLELKLERKSLASENSKYVCLVESFQSCINITYSCPALGARCSPSPSLDSLYDNKSVTFRGDYTKFLAIDISKVTCHDAGYIYHCYSSVNKTDFSVSHSEDFGTISFDMEERFPKMTVTIIESEQTDAKILAVGNKIMMTCSAIVGLSTGSKKVSWVWEESDGGPWTSVSSNSSFQTENCFITGASSHTAQIADGDTCNRRYRCYIQKGGKAFISMAAFHEVVVSECGGLSVAAVNVAIIGGVIFLIGLLAVSVAIVLSRRKKPPEQGEVPQGKERTSFAGDNVITQQGRDRQAGRGDQWSGRR